MELDHDTARPSSCFSSSSAYALTSSLLLFTGLLACSQNSTDVLTAHHSYRSVTRRLSLAPSAQMFKLPASTTALAPAPALTLAPVTPSPVANIGAAADPIAVAAALGPPPAVFETDPDRWGTDAVAAAPSWATDEFSLTTTVAVMPPAFRSVGYPFLNQTAMPTAQARVAPSPAVQGAKSTAAAAPTPSPSILDSSDSSSSGSSSEPSKSSSSGLDTWSAGGGRTFFQASCVFMQLILMSAFAYFYNDKVVEPILRAKGTLKVMNLPETQSDDFENGICECLGDRWVCLHGFCCPLVRIAHTNSVAGVLGFWETVAVYAGWSCLTCGFGPSCLAVYWRMKLKNIMEIGSHPLNDVVVTCCCPSLSICQQATAVDTKLGYQIVGPYDIEFADDKALYMAAF